MQVITVTQDFINSNECTAEMLQELATHKDFGAMQQEEVAKLQKVTNKKDTLPQQKLRSVLVGHLTNSNNVGEVFKAGNMQFEFNCLPDLDINAAGQNKAKRKASTAGSGTATELKGNYVVVKQGVKCTEETDPGKWAIWQHVWACNSFEEYFQKAPKKAVTRTGRVITAASEMRWAVKSKWVKPAEQQA